MNLSRSKILNILGLTTTCIASQVIGFPFEMQTARADSDWVNYANNLCLDAQEYGGPNGANIQLWECNGEKWQKFR